MVWACAWQGERGLTEQREKDSEIEVGTAQMTDLTCFTFLQRSGPLRHKAIRYVITGNACGKLLYASILVASTLLFISAVLQDIHLGLIILNYF